jgi:hypothetical protein
LYRSGGIVMLESASCCAATIQLKRYIVMLGSASCCAATI